MEETNALRSQHGLSPLQWNGVGSERARDHAARMRAAGQLFHSTGFEVEPTLPTGWSWWGEVVGMADLNEATVGELCKAVFDGFVGSDPHREILTSATAGYITVGADVDSGSAWYSVTVFDGPVETEQTEPESDNESPAEPPEFTDDDDSIFEADIEWLAARGITKGCSPTSFCPDDPLTRGQMAAFLVRGFGWSGVESSGFADMDGHMFEDVVATLASVGVTKGCAPDRFCPDESVTRGQLAAFLARALGLPAGSGDHFADDDRSVFEGEIEALVEHGITTGCAPDRYCPDAPILRGQMAAMLRRALDR